MKYNLYRVIERHQMGNRIEYQEVFLSIYDSETNVLLNNYRNIFNLLFNYCKDLTRAELNDIIPQLIINKEITLRTIIKDDIVMLLKLKLVERTAEDEQRAIEAFKMKNKI